MGAVPPPPPELLVFLSKSVPPGHWAAISSDGQKLIIVAAGETEIEARLGAVAKQCPSAMIVRVPGPQEVRRVLQEALDLANEEYKNADLAFREIVHEAPSGALGSDGALRITTAGNRVRSALASYREALTRFTDHLTGGQAPGDLG